MNEYIKIIISDLEDVLTNKEITLEREKESIEICINIISELEKILKINKQWNHKTIKDAIDTIERDIKRAAEGWKIILPITKKEN